MKKCYLIIEGLYPTVHKDLAEAKHYLTFIRDTDKPPAKLKSFYCLFKTTDLKEGFANCKFFSI